MTRAISILLLTLFAGSAASAGEEQAKAPVKTVSEAIVGARTARVPDCSSNDPDEVVVCGRSQTPYRIDPNVLATSRAAEALPPKPGLDATAANPCSGPNCGGGSYVPLVGMALTAIKAVELAAQGDDWRDAFRTRPDQYQLYRQQKAKESKGGITVGVSVGNTHP